MIRMKGDKIPKQFLYGELAEGKRPAHKSKLRCKDCTKNTLQKASIILNDWNIPLNRIVMCMKNSIEVFLKRLPKNLI